MAILYFKNIFLKFFIGNQLIENATASAYFDELISKNELIETPSYKY